MISHFSFGCDISSTVTYITPSFISFYYIVYIERVGKEWSCFFQECNQKFRSGGLNLRQTIQVQSDIVCSVIAQRANVGFLLLFFQRLFY